MSTSEEVTISESGLVAWFSWRKALLYLDEVITSPEMGFKDTRADPNVYIRRARKDDGYEYYEMLLV